MNKQTNEQSSSQVNNILLHICLIVTKSLPGGCTIELKFVITSVECVTINKCVKIPIYRIFASQHVVHFTDSRQSTEHIHRQSPSESWCFGFLFYRFF